MKRLFILAASAAMLMVSCDRSPVSIPEGQTSIVVKISGPGGGTRFSDTPATTSTTSVSITGGRNYVYVVEGSTITWQEALTAVPGGAGQTLASTAGEGGGQRYFPKTAKIYILANIPASILAPESFTTMTDIEEAIVAISTTALSDYTKPAMGNVGGTPKSLDEVLGEGTATPTATANVTISPLFTRVELAGVNGGTRMASFTLAGVYLNNYHSSYSMTGAGSELKDSGKSTTFNLASWLGDEPGASWSSDADNVTDQETIVPAEDKVWAYHVGAGTLVKVILHLTDPMVYEIDTPASGEEPEKLRTEATALKIDGNPVTEAFLTVSNYTRSYSTPSSWP